MTTKTEDPHNFGSFVMTPNSNISNPPEMNVMKHRRLKTAISRSENQTNSLY